MLPGTSWEIRDWSKIPPVVAPDIPDHLVVHIEGVVSTVFKLQSAGARVKREHSNSSFLRILVSFPNSIRLPNLHVLLTLFICAHH
jgi:hypothetical protein